jgi:hypothetical protein
MKSKSLSSTPHIDCETCQVHLADYIRLELAGQAAEQTYPEVALHVETCPKCEVAYYREFRAQGQRKSVPELQQIGQRSQVAQVMQQIVSPAGPQPIPDPSWYEIALTHGRAWLEQETGRWRQLVLSLATLGQGPHGTPALAGLMSLAPSAASVLGDIEIISPDDNYEIKLAVVSDSTAAAEDMCRVEVAVSCQDRFGDFSGIEVTLWWGGSAHTRETDALGRVSFEGLPCQQLPFMNLGVVLG